MQQPRLGLADASLLQSVAVYQEVEEPRGVLAPMQVCGVWLYYVCCLGGQSCWLATHGVQLCSQFGLYQGSKAAAMGAGPSRC
jgi:hypothetical protein